MDIFARGASVIEHHKPNSYYECMLQLPQDMHSLYVFICIALTYRYLYVDLVFFYPITCEFRGNEMFELTLWSSCARTA